MIDTFEAKCTEPKTLTDKIALKIVKGLRIPADLSFAKRYGHRAIVLETVAAVPGRWYATTSKITTINETGRRLDSYVIR